MITAIPHTVTCVGWSDLLVTLPTVTVRNCSLEACRLTVLATQELLMSTHVFTHIDVSKRETSGACYAIWKLWRSFLKYSFLYKQAVRRRKLS